MESQSSSDEEDDRRHLIEQNQTRNDFPPKSSNSPPPHSSFHIEERPRPRPRSPADFKSRFSTVAPLCPNFHFSKRYLFAIFLPLFILILYFTTDFRTLFQTSLPSHPNFDSSISRMRDSELRALYLLRQQQLGLLKLWNHTLLLNNTSSSPSVYSSLNFSSSNNVHTLASSLSSGGFLEDLKSDLLTHISLNKQIQQVLLSTHQLGGDAFDSASSDNATDPSVGPAAFDKCRKVDQRLSQRRTIEWNPKSNKYLFAVCVSGQMSNHLICLEKHMFFAALLNRVLVIPSSKVDYEFHRVLDIDHINKCLGRKVVVTFEEFAESKKNHIHINKFICYFSSPQPCFLDDEHVKKLKALGVSIAKLEAPWTDDVKQPKKRTVQDVVSKFSSGEDVIAIGDVFFADLENDWVMQPGGPIAHTCKTLIEPSRFIMLTAQRFVQTFLGRDFIALHFRRHGFLKFCNAKQPSCFYPVPQAADCINQVVERANTPVIYLSTDAAESETGLLQSLLFFNGKTVPLVKRPARNPAEKWDALLYRNRLESDPQVEAMLDKTICALSTVFIGAPGSTFTEDIRRLRKDWGSASLCDEYLCQNEVPNFIAEDE